MSHVDPGSIHELAVGTSDGPLQSFIRDLGWGIRSWAKEPSVPIFVALVYAGIAYSLYIPFIVLFLLFPLRLAAIGFYAVPWGFYLRASEGKCLPWNEMLAVIWRYFRRFLRLGLIVLACFVIPVAAVLLAILHREGRSGNLLAHPPTWYWISAVMLSVVIDAVLTFAAPALVYTTDAALEALGEGLRFMRTTWPSSAFYVMTPGITLSIVGVVIPRSIVGIGGKVAIAAVGAVVGLAFKGAIAAFYLRGHQDRWDRLPLIAGFFVG